MRSSFRHRPILRTAARVYLSPLIVIGGLALFVLGFGLLAVAIQAIAALLRVA